MKGRREKEKTKASCCGRCYFSLLFFSRPNLSVLAVKCSECLHFTPELKSSQEEVRRTQENRNQFRQKSMVNNCTYGRTTAPAPIRTHAVLNVQIYKLHKSSKYISIYRKCSSSCVLFFQIKMSRVQNHGHTPWLIYVCVCVCTRISTLVLLYTCACRQVRDYG